jgi:hypothetical protein
MKARLLLRERLIMAEDRFADLVIWDVPVPVTGCHHVYRYRLAYVVNEVCVLRYDNEAGKGDHRHMEETESPYEFTTTTQLLADFRQDIENWRP